MGQQLLPGDLDDLVQLSKTDIRWSVSCDFYVPADAVYLTANSIISQSSSVNVVSSRWFGDTALYGFHTKIHHSIVQILWFCVFSWKDDTEAALYCNWPSLLIQLQRFKCLVSQLAVKVMTRRSIKQNALNSLLRTPQLETDFHCLLHNVWRKREIHNQAPAESLMFCTSSPHTFSSI